MMKQHKWHKEIKAWADGVEIEYKNNSRKMCWTKCESPVFDTEAGYEYRIKPQPVEPQYLYVWTTEIGIALTKPKDIVPRKYEYIGKIPLIVESDDD